MVVVSLGLDEVVGLAVEVYGPSARGCVLVRVPIHGPSGETPDESNISFPADTLRVVTPG